MKTLKRRKRCSINQNGNRGNGIAMGHNKGGGNGHDDGQGVGHGGVHGGGCGGGHGGGNNK